MVEPSWQMWRITFHVISSHKPSSSETVLGVLNNSKFHFYSCHEMERTIDNKLEVKERRELSN